MGSWRRQPIHAGCFSAELRLAEARGQGLLFGIGGPSPLSSPRRPYVSFCGAIRAGACGSQLLVSLRVRAEQKRSALLSGSIYSICLDSLVKDFLDYFPSAFCAWPLSRRFFATEPPTEDTRT